MQDYSFLGVKLGFTLVMYGLRTRTRLSDRKLGFTLSHDKLSFTNFNFVNDNGVDNDYYYFDQLSGSLVSVMVTKCK